MRPTLFIAIHHVDGVLFETLNFIHGLL